MPAENSKQGEHAPLGATPRTQLAVRTVDAPDVVGELPVEERLAIRSGGANQREMVQIHQYVGVTCGSTFRRRIAEVAHLIVRTRRPLSGQELSPLRVHAFALLTTSLI